MDHLVEAAADARRQAVLDHAIGTYVEHGYKVESVHGFQAVMVKRRSVFTLFNALMTVVTAGLWLIVMVIRAIDPLVDRAVLTVDRRGELHGRFS